MDYVSERDHHASAHSPKRLSRCSRREADLCGTLDQSPRFGIPILINHCEWSGLFAVWCPTVIQALSGSIHLRRGVGRDFVNVLKIFGASVRVGTVIAVSVQEDIVVALANVKHSVGLFENLVAASSEPGRCGQSLQCCTKLIAVRSTGRSSNSEGLRGVISHHDAESV